MRFNKSSLVLTLSSIVLIILATPFLFGLLFKHFVLNQVNTENHLINGWKEAGFEIEIKKSYPRLFYTDIEVALKTKEETIKLFGSNNFLKTVRVYHGPFYWKEGKLKFGIGHFDFFLMDNYTIAGNIDYGILERPNVSFNFPKYHYENKTTKTDIAESKLKISNMGNAWKDARYEVQLGEIRTEGLGQQILTVKPIAAMMNVKLLAFYKDQRALPIGSGNASFNLAGISYDQKLGDKEINIFKLDEIDYQMNSPVSADLATFGINNMIALKKIVLPGYMVDEINLDWSFNGLAVEPVMEFVLFAKNNESKLKNATTKELQKENGEMALNQFEKLGLGLLKKEPEVVLSKLGLKMQGGFVESQGNLKFLDPKTEKWDKKAIGNNLKGNFKVIVSDSLLRFFLTQLAPSANQEAQEAMLKEVTEKNKFFLKKGINYEAELEIKEGKLILNGQDITQKLIH
ncbi:MAG: DUF945 family protein [Gammaproteobacteria bacterium]